ncbi:hypothetical protein ACLOJK_040289 [Asimina triloba]
MLLKNPIRRTKKLFHKTLQRIKASLSSGYQRLPKPPPCNPFSCVHDSMLGNSFRDIESFCNDQWRDADDHEEKKMGSRRRKIKIKELESGEVRMGSARFLNCECEGRSCSQRSARLTIQEITEGAGSSSRRLRFHACRVVSERLKELEKMEASDVDHVLDVEEVLHYYSRIKCPLYVDIFNKFFLEMFVEMLPQASSSQGNVSRRISKH